MSKMLNPLEQRKEIESKISFSERWEEELKQKLFEKESSKTDVEEIINKRVNLIHKERPTEEWDVPITEDIQYFDPDLSYEITQYRPITMDKGLDFDPEPFREIASIYERTGKYTEFPPGRKSYNDFWEKEYDKCEQGITIGKYRITGDHYFFLNYYRMETIIEDAISGSGRKESFPGFLSKQYEFFHYVEMCEKLGKDVCFLKGRGQGASEMLASLAVRPYTTHKGYHVMLTCDSDAKLAPLREKCWRQLDWLNMNTNGGMRHARLVMNNNDTKRASLKTPDGVEYGWRSQIDTVVSDNPNKIRGSRLDRLIYDEAGSNAQLTEAWIKGDALVSLGGKHFGVKLCAGTGGDDTAITGLRTMFYNPEGYNVLPFKNVDSDSGNPELTAFFIPSHKFALTSEYLDNRGVTDYIKFKKYYEDKRSKLSDRDFLNECAEHCFTPREALAKHGDNIFDAATIAERIIQISTNKGYTKPRKMQLIWDKAVGGGMEKVIARESESGELLVVEPPLLDETGKPYKNLYVAGIDAIDMGSNDSASDSNVSDFCVVIKKRVLGTEDPKYVAMYKYRPDDIRKAYDLTMKLLVWYNCKAMLEYTKISIQTYFREKGKDGLFMTRPSFAVGNKRRTNKNLIGLPATDAVIKHGLELIGNFINDYWHTIDFTEMLDQMLNYSYENKRKFDIIAAMGMCEIGDEDMTGVTPTTVENNKEWRDFGWYTDENGYKKRGILPIK